MTTLEQKAREAADSAADQWMDNDADSCIVGILADGFKRGYLVAAEPREATLKERDAEIAKLKARILELESRPSSYPGARAPISVPT